MQIFFSSLASLEYFTHSLQTLVPENTCRNCSKNNQWVSHGYVYKQRSIQQNMIVGKRILCSKRYGKEGCGQSRQLYLEPFIPRRHYPMEVIIAFILQLLDGVSVAAAYHKTTGLHHRDPRHAWRWVRALYKQLGRFRSYVNKHRDVHNLYASHRSRRLAILLPTLHALFISRAAATHVQFHDQRAFF